MVVTLSSALGIIIPADVLRLNNAGFERFYEGCLGFLMRDSEKVRLASRLIDLTCIEDSHRKGPTA